jgi:hypothetical protein
LTDTLVEQIIAGLVVSLVGWSFGWLSEKRGAGRVILGIGVVILVLASGQWLYQKSRAREDGGPTRTTAQPGGPPVATEKGPEGPTTSTPPTLKPTPAPAVEPPVDPTRYIDASARATAVVVIRGEQVAQDVASAAAAGINGVDDYFKDRFFADRLFDEAVRGESRRVSIVLGAAAPTLFVFGRASSRASDQVVAGESLKRLEISVTGRMYRRGSTITSKAFHVRGIGAGGYESTAAENAVSAATENLVAAVGAWR